MHHFDAIVVGARCAGAAAATYLSRAGFRVLLIDRTFFPSDVVSTHTIFNNTVDVLRDLGVLEKLLATDTDPVKGIRFQFDDAVIEGDLPVYNGEANSYCFRRTHFDKIMLEHAREQEHVTALEGFRVTDVIREGGVVVGVKGQDREGVEQEYRAKIVIGADGRVSTIRRAVDAQLVLATPTEYATYYGYFGDFATHPDSRFEIYQFGILRAYVFPTSDGHHVVAATFPLADPEWVQQFKTRPEQALRAYIGAHFDSMAERLQTAKLAEPMKGMLDFDNHWYEAMGPGYALVGDAFCFKDPGMGQGMHDAIFGARILAEVLTEYRDWGHTWTELTTEYQKRLEQEFMVRFQMCCQITKALFFTEEEAAFHQAVASHPVASQKFIGIYNYAHEPAELEEVFAGEKA